MKRLLVLLFISILTTGCAGGKNLDVASGENSANIANSEMAYVLVNVAGAHTTWVHVDIHYANKTDNLHRAVFSVPESWAALVNNSKYHFVQLKPGSYTMIQFIQDRGRIIYQMTDAARQRNEALKHQGGLYASFTVEKGKINYIGDMKIGLLDGSGLVPLEIKDNSPAAVEYLRKKYPNLDAAQLLKYAPIRKGTYTR